jgi:cytochrome c553
MKRFAFLAIAGFTALGLLATSSRLEAKVEYSKKEKTPCTTCHTKNGAKELNDKGNYYKEHKALPK